MSAGFSYNMILAEPPHTGTTTSAMAVDSDAGSEEAAAAAVAVLLEIDTENMVRVTRGKDCKADDPVHMLQLTLTKNTDAGTFTLSGSTMSPLFTRSVAELCRDGFSCLLNKRLPLAACRLPLAACKHHVITLQQI